MTIFRSIQLLVIVLFAVISILSFFNRRKNPHWSWSWIATLSLVLLATSVWAFISDFILLNHPVLNVTNSYLLNLIYAVCAIVILRKVIIGSRKL